MVSITDRGRPVCKKNNVKHMDNNVCNLSWANLKYSARKSSDPAALPDFNWLTKLLTSLAETVMSVA